MTFICVIRWFGFCAVLSGYHHGVYISVLVQYYPYNDYIHANDCKWEMDHFLETAERAALFTGSARAR